MDEGQQRGEQSSKALPDDLFSSGSSLFYALWLRGQGREEEAVAVFREAAHRQSATEDFEFGCHTLNVRSSCSSESRNLAVAFFHELDPFFICSMSPYLFFGAHPLNYING